MSNPLAEYLSALEARDARERAHATIINQYTKLADRTAALSIQSTPAIEPPAPSPSHSARSIRPGTPKGKGSPALQDTASPNNLAQIRAELASTNKTRFDLEAKVSTQIVEIDTLKGTDAEQKKRISQLEKLKEQLERKLKDRHAELTGKGKLVVDVQDEMVALNLQLNMAEQEKERLRKENEELITRWKEKMEREAQRMNDQSGWKDSRSR
ncbi:autophagy protein 16 [Lojkania enalia]|uniref:Autophagy protein 16 n=1 Tax=Lojkania enalia TaxID=147567 RepID=A0A9P4TQN7_9PLEO|nr:autophagy protein 16 [Didymosphaeria enalia]